MADDSAIPSGNGMLLRVLAQLYHLTGVLIGEANAEDTAALRRVIYERDFSVRVR